jgi:hypothetical protein
MLTEIPTRDDASLLRSRRGMEIPTAGAWSIHTASFVGIRDRRGDHTQARVIDGSLNLGDHAIDDGFWIAVEHAGEVRQLIVGSTRFEPTGDGFGRWHMVGSLCGEGVATRITLTLDHRGVYRRGDRAFAWLTGIGRSDATVGRLRRRPELTLSFDLVAKVPEV